MGYAQYRCCKCHRQYNERTGTKLNFIEYPTEVVMIAVHYYFRFKVSLDDIVELMAMRGFHLSHQIIQNWVQIFGVELGIKLRERRKGKAGKKWHVDPTYSAPILRSCKEQSPEFKRGWNASNYHKDMDKTMIRCWLCSSKSRSGSDLQNTCKVM